MGGDYTRFTFKPEKNFSGVLKQQGRVSLDSDWNELAEITGRRWRSETMDIIGGCVVPSTTPEAFRVAPTGAGAFAIGIGRAYVDGLQVECHGAAPAVYDPVLAETRGTVPPSYDDQPYWPAPLPLSLTAPALPPVAGRTDLVYLDVWQREITVAEAPEIREIALGGPDTTTRVQTAWQVKVIPDVEMMACADECAEWETATRPSAGRLTTSGITPPPEDNPCAIEAAGGYRGIENRLYRIEIHTGGAPGTARFKWSRNNAAIVSAVTGISASADRITVESIGRDDRLRFDIGDRVEISDDHLEFQCLPGHMAKITHIDEAGRVITIDKAVAASAGFDPADPRRHTRMRRWDQRSGLDADGLLTVPAPAGEPVEIEDGIQVAFDLDPAIAGGQFKAGDYWVFHARTADGSVDLLKNAPPRGVQHHYCRLALVTWGTGAQDAIVRDCRVIWPPRSCCQITVRPGEDIQAAIDAVPEEGGCVCLLEGVHPVYRPLIIDGRKHILLTGVGAATRLVFGPPAAQDPAQALLYVVGGSWDIQILRMLAHTDVLEHLLFIDEACENIAVGGCRLINGTPSQKMTGTDSACIVLGQCCDVRVSECEIVGRLGIVQAGAETLERARKALSRLRPSETPAGGPGAAPANEEEPEPAAVGTLRALRIEGNRMHARIGIQLMDVLSGGIENNHLHTITGERFATFMRSANLPPQDPDGGPATVSQEALYAILVENLKGLSPCPEPQAEQEEDGEQESRTGQVAIPDDTIGVLACLMEDMAIRGNAITAAEAIALEYSRSVSVSGNAITANASGVRLNYAFDLDIENNRIRIAMEDDPEDEQEIDFKTLWRQYDPGACGVGFRFARGIRIHGNDLDAHTAIATRKGGWKGCRDDIQPDALLRVLRIERPWRVAVELVWFLYQLLYSLSASASADAAGVIEETTKPDLEGKLFTMLLGLLGHSLFPACVGKAEISDNRMTVTRFGTLLYKIFSVSGIRILRNRISGHQKTGILIHPWYSVGLADVFARFIRCMITLALVFLTMLRDMLRRFLDGDASAPQSEAGFAGGTLGILAMGVSWIQILCSRYCGGAAPAEDEEEETPPSPAEILADALDGFLADADVGWLDDLVNQTCAIDGNSLAGSGDGIWTGIDGSRITGNEVIVWPSGSVAYETMIFGILLKQHFTIGNEAFCNDEIRFLANSAMDLDRDMVLFGCAKAAGWVQQFVAEPSFRARLRSFLSAWSAQVDPSSPLATPVAEMQAGLDENSLDPDRVQLAWQRLLLLMATDLRGYGIAMRGANMVCKDNGVESRTGCPAPFQTQKRASSAAHLLAAARPAMVFPWGGQAMVAAPAIGGIWQFSNAAGLFIDLYEILWAELGKKDHDRDYIYRIILLVIFFWVLSTQKERSQQVDGNRVQKPLAHGIRMITDAGLEEVDIRDNTVRDALRHGIVFTPGLLNLFDRGLHCRIQRNTVIRDSAIVAFADWNGGDEPFASLITIDNGNAEVGGTTLLAHNHGTDSTLSGQDGAVRVETGIAGVNANHVVTAADHALVVDADDGLFTDNMSNRPNDVSPASIVQGPNITNL